MQGKDAAAFNCLINIEKRYLLRQSRKFRPSRRTRLGHNQIRVCQLAEHSPDYDGVGVNTLRHLLGFQRLLIRPRHKRENMDSYRESATG